MPAPTTWFWCRSITGLTCLATPIWARHWAPDYQTSANAGQLDIVQALKWVRDNIAAFGGDPNNVTIRGQSGGGSKVSVLLAMPAAHGLFHKAIIESGPGLRAGSTEGAAKNAAMLIETLGGKDKLRTATMSELLTAFFVMQGKLPGGGGAPGGFSPIVDGAALPRHPYDPDATPLSAQVPLLIGSTHHEQATFSIGQTIADDAALLTAVKRTVPKEGAAEKAIAAYRAAYPNESPKFISILIGTDAGSGSRTRTLADRKSAQAGAGLRLSLRLGDQGAERSVPRHARHGHLVHLQQHRPRSAGRRRSDRRGIGGQSGAQLGRLHAHWQSHGAGRPRNLAALLISKSASDDYQQSEPRRT